MRIFVLSSLQNKNNWEQKIFLEEQAQASSVICFFFWKNEEQKNNGLSWSGVYIVSDFLK